MKKIIIYISLIMLGFVFGVLWRQFMIFPFHQLQNIRYNLTLKNFVTIYDGYNPLFSNRYYVESNANPILKGGGC